MAHSMSNIKFVVKPVPSGGGPGEFRQSMAPHPLVHQLLLSLPLQPGTAANSQPTNTNTLLLPIPVPCM